MDEETKPHYPPELDYLAHLDARVSAIEAMIADAKADRESQIKQNQENNS